MLAAARVLVTGATGRLARTIARTLVEHGNVVYGAARFSDPSTEDELRGAGIVPVRFDLAVDDPATLPDDVTHVFHAGAMTGREVFTDRAGAFATNADAPGRLLRRYPDATAFVHCSTGSVYGYQRGRPLREDDPYGIHIPVYSQTKISGEAVVRAAAEITGVPTTIIRIFSTYGPQGGAPADRFARVLAGKAVRLHPDAPNRYTPIYEDDSVALGVRALECAATPPLVVNFAGSETVSAEDYLAYLGELAGVEPRIEYSPTALTPLWADTTLMEATLGPTAVPWRAGMRRMYESRFARTQ